MTVTPWVRSASLMPIVRDEGLHARDFGGGLATDLHRHEHVRPVYPRHSGNRIVGEDLAVVEIWQVIPVGKDVNSLRQRRRSRILSPCQRKMYSP